MLSFSGNVNAYCTEKDSPVFLRVNEFNDDFKKKWFLTRLNFFLINHKY